MPTPVVKTERTVDISAGADIFSIFAAVGYKQWYAIAEFVDNSWQSWLDNRADLEPVLRVSISVTDDCLVIEDNAGGIAEGAAEQRAFRIGAPPPVENGLNQFGMGMKTAAFWFSDKWDLVTKAVGEKKAKRIAFDVAEIQRDDLQTLPIEFLPEERRSGTTIKLYCRDGRMPKAGRTIGKIRDHLASIYREPISNGHMVLEILGEVLEYPARGVMEARPEEAVVRKALREGAPIDADQVVNWRREINFPMDVCLSDGSKKTITVDGWVALDSFMDPNKSGLALLHQGRVAQGSGYEDLYIPHELFGARNMYRARRMYGELKLVGMPIAHTKQGFNWQGDEEANFLIAMKACLTQSPDFLIQAEQYRANSRNEDDEQSDLDAIEEISSGIEGADIPSDVLPPEPVVPPPPRPPAIETDRVFSATLCGETYQVTIVEDTTIDVILKVDTAPENRRICLRVNPEHAFVRRKMAHEDQKTTGYQMLVAIGLAEVIAIRQGDTSVGSIRRRMSSILKNPLARV